MFLCAATGLVMLPKISESSLDDSAFVLDYQVRAVDESLGPLEYFSAINRFTVVLIACSTVSMSDSSSILDLHSLYDRYISRSPLYIQSTLKQRVYRKKLYVIFSSFQHCRPHDILFLVLEYYGVDGKWINVGESKLCVIKHEIMSRSYIAYNPNTDEYCLKEFNSSNILSYIADDNSNSISHRLSKSHQNVLSCFDNEGACYGIESNAFCKTNVLDEVIWRAHSGITESSYCGN